MMSNKEKKRRQHEKELNSLRNKLSGSLIVWFDSLSTQRKYDLLFEWKYLKHIKRGINTPQIKKIKRRNRFPRNGSHLPTTKIEIVKSITYPASFKHFIEMKRRTFRYKPHVANIRNTTIDLLLNEQ